MRILHVIPSVAAVRGGPSKAVLELAAEQKRTGIDAEIATTNDNANTLLQVPLHELTEWEGAAVRFFPRYSSHFRPLRDFAFSPSLGRWLHQQVHNYSLVHVHALFSYPSSIAMRIARQKRVPYINRPSGLLCRWSLKQSTLRKKIVLKLIDRANLEESAAIEFTSEQEREETGDLALGARSFIMPYGIHMPQEIPNPGQLLRQKLDLPDCSRLVLFLSRIHHKKGIHHLIEAATRIQHPEVHYIIAGSGDAEYETELRRLADCERLRGRVHLVGFASGNWKDTLLQGSDLFVLPSYSESFAIAVMEALAVGLPVITTPGVPLASLVEKHDLGSICLPDATALAEKLELELAALSDIEQANARRTRAKLLIQRNYSWACITPRLFKAYEAILANQEPPSFEIKDAQCPV